MHLRGMLGLGDSLHSRAVVSHYARRGAVVLETPWPCLFHDIEGITFVVPTRHLRTQDKNVRRERSAYSSCTGGGARIWYSHDGVRRHGTFLAAMCAESGAAMTDFGLPIPDAWREKALSWIDHWRPDKPLMLYRPLVERTEWSGCRARNPDASVYTGLARSVKDDFFSVSVADLEPGIEWLASPDLGTDVQCHRGEIDIETLAALAAMAGLVWCSPGFMLVLAQAVRAPMVAVFGGHEAPRFYDHGFTENHFIGHGCECFSKVHACDKRIDCDAAAARLRDFLANHKKPAVGAALAA